MDDTLTPNDREVLPDVRQIIAWLDRLAVVDARCALAAGFLRGRPGGRPAISDDAALVEIGWLLENGTARSVESAAKLVAATLGGFHSVSSTATRIAKKYRKTFPDETI
jgi:hypothetical protein